MKASRMLRRGHAIVQTRDVDTAEQMLSRCYLPLRLRTARPGSVLSARLNTVDLGLATVGALRFGTELRIVTAEADNFHVDIPVAGVAVSRPGSADEVVTEPGAAQVFMPGERADLQWSADTRQVCVMIQKSSLERTLAALLHADLSRPLKFEAMMDLGTPGGRAWAQVLRLLDHELRRDDGLLEHGLTRRTLERLLIESLLTGHEHNYSGRLRRQPVGAGVRAIRTAVDLLENQPERPWTVGQLAEEVGLSVRALHAGFRSTLDTGPMAYLRNVRLARVHEDLVQADPGTTKVSTTARRWGFAHLGRFSGAYAERYGQSPSTTLHGTRVGVRPRSPGSAVLPEHVTSPWRTAALPE